MKGSIGGSRGRCQRAPPGSRFFHFDIQILQNVAASGVGAPARVGAPYGKSWIRHWGDISFRQKLEDIFYKLLDRHLCTKRYA